LEKGKRSIIFYEIKVAPQHCFVIYFMARRASAVGLFSNFERLVELSQSTSGVFLHIYILIIGKPPLSLSLSLSLSLFQIKFFLLPFSIILCFFVRHVYVFFSVPFLSLAIKTQKRNVSLQVNKRKKEFQAHLIIPTFPSHRFLIPHYLLALTLPIHFNFIKNLPGFLRLEFLQSALTFIGYNLKYSRRRKDFKC